ncbi:hypothetical protein FRC08_005503 [Ceratobasidium sp. 394]|nr:hypothetical protein FRC08_005503 [Ceratobasidium sp. 394]
MSQDDSADEQDVLPQALAKALVSHINTCVVQPLENRLQAQNVRFDELADRNAEFQNNVLSLLGGGAPQPPGPLAQAGSSRRRRGSTIPRPNKSSETQMQKVVRRIIKTGCGLKNLKDAKPGLSHEELQERIANNPALPWRPDWLKLIDDEANKYWVDKILDATMDDIPARALVEKGDIAEAFWTRECVHKRILAPMWSNVRREVKQLVDEGAAARGKANRSKTNRDGRNKRLYNARLKLTTGTGERPRFEYRIDNRMRHIPVELMVEEIMSDVAEEEYDSESIPTEVTRDEYRKDRPRFEYEGRPPFFRRREPWNGIFQAMDEITSHKNKGFGIQARYYAGNITRGQRTDVSPDMASKIPVVDLYRCHISKEWYDRLSDAQRDVLKASPPRWEVDEERITV